eukprot:6172084-Pleurochrysis_carterae.AAC.1
MEHGRLLPDPRFCIPRSSIRAHAALIVLSQGGWRVVTYVLVSTSCHKPIRCNRTGHYSP